MNKSGCGYWFCPTRSMVMNTSFPWWRHQMETFSTLLVICAGNWPVPGEFHTQRPVTRSFDVFFDLRLNKRFSKQSWGWWLETLSRPLWCHCNVYNPSPPRMCLSLDLVSEYRIQHGANGPLYVTSSYSTWIFCWGVSGFATDCPCGV